jgi:hypothetical protein
MKEFTAKEAKDMANNSGAASRVTRYILRHIKRAARRGRYSLNIGYADWDSVVIGKVCDNLKAMGYTAFADDWRTAIYISWKGEA